MAKVGRPSKYDEKYCEEIINFMAQGKSKEAFAGSIGVSKDTIYEWIKVHKEFSDSVKRAEVQCQNFWEEMGIQMALAGQGNATVWIFNMKNRFSWKDKNETEITAGEGMSIKLDIRNGDRVHNPS